MNEYITQLLEKKSLEELREYLKSIVPITEDNELDAKLTVSGGYNDYFNLQKHILVLSCLVEDRSIFDLILDDFLNPYNEELLGEFVTDLFFLEHLKGFYYYTQQNLDKTDFKNPEQLAMFLQGFHSYCEELYIEEWALEDRKIEEDAAAGESTEAEDKPVNIRGRSDLHEAIIDENLELFLDLITKGADVNATDAYNSTPLHFAASYGTLDMVKALLEYGANPKAINDRGATALHDAAFSGDIKIFHLLEQHGCSTLELDSSGQSVLHYAVQGLTADRGWCMNIIEYLVDQGLDLDTPNIHGTSARSMVSCSEYWCDPFFYAGDSNDESSDNELDIIGSDNDNM